MSNVAESTPDTAAEHADSITRASLAELVALRQQLPRRLAAELAVVRSGRSGTHAATARGRGMDYRESRAYQPGDDVRRLDWRLTARSGRLHTKLFQEERERSLMLLIDTHASMQFGTQCRFKSVQAARAAGLSAWLAAATGMRVGVAGFGLQRGVMRPRAGPRGALAALHAIDGLQAHEKQATENEVLSDALRRVSRLARSGSQVLLISDGFNVDDAARAGLIGLQRQSGVSVLVVADALETTMPPSGQYPLAWEDRVRQVNLTAPGARKAFQQRMGAGPQRLQAMAADLGLRCARIDTCEQPLPALTQVLGIGMRGPKR